MDRATSNVILVFCIVVAIAAPMISLAAMAMAAG